MKKTRNKKEKSLKTDAQVTIVLTSKEIQEFQLLIMDWYSDHAREGLPWRATDRTAYQVLISEVMLQQTQVDRTIPFFQKWIKRFPDFQSLSSAPQRDLLGYWKGLGYNSRALRLKKLAQRVIDEYAGVLPKRYDTLCSLPGIGPYTAGAVRAFAFGEATPIIETNIRRVCIHHFEKELELYDFSDKAILSIVQQLIPEQSNISIADWYWALMDYGSQLPKELGHNPNKKSKSYTRQKKFQGSDRQVRGTILEILLTSPSGGVVYESLFEEVRDQIIKKAPGDPLTRSRFEKIHSDLDMEGFIVNENISGQVHVGLR